MNQGKRYILYTVLALCGATTLAMAATRVYVATVDDNTPRWLRNVISLGLAVEMNPGPPTLLTATAPDKMATLRDFNQVIVDGDFTVEIVSAAEYKVSLTSASTQPWSISAALQKYGPLTLTAGAGSEGAVLRIETPALTSIDARNLRQLTIHGWQIPALALRMKNLGGVRIEESSGKSWTLSAETPTTLQLDRATFAGDISFKSSGRISFQNAEDGKTLLGVVGNESRVTFRSNKSP